MNVEFRCVLCGRAYGPAEVRYACPACGPDGVLRVLHPGVRDPVDPAAAGMWRCRPLPPLGVGGASPPLPVGGAPLQRIGGRLAAALRLPELWIKDDTRNPTGSLKDRASAPVARTGKRGASGRLRVAFRPATRRSSCW